MYALNRRTKVIHTTNCGFKRIMKNSDEKFDYKKAIDDGCCFCTHCSTVMKALKKEKQWLDEFCKDKKIRYWDEGGALIVSTPCSFFRIVPTFDGKGMYLWHQNGRICRSLEKFTHFHRQSVHSYTLEDMFRYIDKHESFRKNNPVGINAPKTNVEQSKGGRIGKAQKKRIQRYENLVNKINRVNNLYFLFNQIEAARRA